MDFKVMLRNYLIENGLTQEQFGEMVGVTGPAVNTWVLGKRKLGDNDGTVKPDYLYHLLRHQLHD